MAVLVGREAPRFNTTAVLGDTTLNDFKLTDLKGKKYAILFFYPKDFTFVCPTELHEFEASRKAFAELNCEIIGCSVDSADSHKKWLATSKADGGIKGVSYPIIADVDKSVCKSFDVLTKDNVALRATFVIDKHGIVQVELINNLSIGRSVVEVYRALQALQFTEEHGEVCPANWQKGQRGMKATKEGVKSYFAK